MKRNNIDGRKLRVDRRSTRGQGKTRNRVGVEDGKTLQWLQINLGRVEPCGFVGPVRPHDKLRARAQAHVGLEDAVRVVQIGQDQIELGEVVRQIFGQVAAAGEKAGKSARFDGLNPVHQAARQSQLGNVRVPEDFEVGRRKQPAQRGYRRQRQYEVPNRPTSNDQNPAPKRTHMMNLANTRRAYTATLNTVSPSPATNRPKASLIPQPTLMRPSFAVPQASKSRSRHGETVSQMPATTNAYAHV